ncbi:P-loop containing nucleoside triphosphate hydrolase protein [Hysterangium stoloniferum]|nr:P-loop containing nucleoside triphosphate hydrolase protein [Hysterangium stoloniferum]
MPGPHVIMVPKSTLQNWAREFAKWAPDFEVVVLTGNREERAEIVASRLLPQKFEVSITSYEMCLREKNVFKKFPFSYIVIDEAHRIKNVDSILSQIVRIFISRGRMLITGPPLQNNLQELFSLLNFICPEIFSDFIDLDSFLQKDDKSGSGEDASKKVVGALHKILRPFLLRRVKVDVEKNLLPKKEGNIYVGLTDMQRKWYRSMLEKDIDAITGLSGKKEGKARLMNIVMQLRKGWELSSHCLCGRYRYLPHAVTCHPYLFDGGEPGPPYTTDEHLIDNCGKMIILDKLLHQMKAKGFRVLVFNQMSRVLDILEDHCTFRRYRARGEKFIFLLTTRAGGLGINLTTADIVVLYDSDWNPQADLQAMDRAHRIGQTKQVYVSRLITENSVEERMLERAAQKLRLDQLDPQNEYETPEMLEAERAAEQAIIDNAEPLTEEEIARKEELSRHGFDNWSKRDFQQCVKAVEAHGRDAPDEVLAQEMKHKIAEEVKAYAKVFWKRWRELEDFQRLEQRILEGEARREKQDNLVALLDEKIKSVQCPMQELELNYPIAKGKLCEEKEDRYLLCRLNYYGLKSPDSRTPQELSKRCHALLGAIAKEYENKVKDGQQKKNVKGPRGTKSSLVEVADVQSLRRSTRNAVAVAPAKSSHKKKKADGPRWNTLVIRLQQYNPSQAVVFPTLTYALRSIKPDYAFLSGYALICPFHHVDPSHLMFHSHTKTSPIRLRVRSPTPGPDPLARRPTCPSIPIGITPKGTH